MTDKTVKAIEFAILSPDMIRKMSAVEITSDRTYDEDGFPVEGGLMDPHLGVVDPGLRCKTCGQKIGKCPGHFGHLELVRPVIHALFSKHIDYFLRATCRKCGRLVLTEKQIKDLEKLPREERLKAAAKMGDKVKKCPHCGEPREKIEFLRPHFFYIGEGENKRQLWPTEIRDWLEKIPDEDVKILGFNPEKFRPEWTVLTVLPIPPVTVRPSIILETGERAEDDLTHKLVEIVKTNQRLKEHIETGAPQLIIEDMWNLLQYHVTTYFNNQSPGIAPAKHRAGRPLRTLLERLSGKEGRFRYNLSGKRVNFAGRSVIVPDPSLSLNEVGIPAELAKIITVPYHVTEWNVDEAKKLILDGKVAYIKRPDGVRRKITDTNREEAAEEVAPGYVLEKYVTDGDITLFNRQPSLHSVSMMAHEARVLPGKVLRIQPLVCPPYNADFDGDEMNFHLPQIPEAQAEARELMRPQEHIISVRHGSPIIGGSEDYITAAYMLSKSKFTREEAWDLLYHVGIEPPEDLPEEVSGKELISFLIPEEITMEFRSKFCSAVISAGKCSLDKCKKEKCPFDAYVKIEKGKLVSGVLDDAAIGTGPGSGLLIDEIFRRLGPDRAREFLDRFGRLVLRAMTMIGITMSLEDVKVPEEVMKKIEEIRERKLEEMREVVKKYREGTLEPIPGRSVEESLDLYMLQINAEMTKEIDKLLMAYKLDVEEKTGVFGFHDIVMTGAKGNTMNIRRLMALEGQITVHEKRPHRGFRGRVIAHFPKGDLGPEARGFVKNSLYSGLTMRELFFSAVGGRMGEIDKGVAPQISGYYYRRLVNALMDMRVYYDGTVREATTDTIVQFVYGDDGLLPRHTKKGSVPLSLIFGEEYVTGKH